MKTDQAYYCPSEMLAPTAVQIRFSETDELQIHGPNLDLRIPLADIKVSDRIGSIPRFLYLPDGATIEAHANDTIDAVLTRQNGGRANTLIHILEKHQQVALVATLIIVVLVALTMKWGIPYLSSRTAERIPPSMEAQLGNAALASISQVLGRSQLSETEHQRINDRLQSLLKYRETDTPVQLSFCSMGEAFPNAFALPGGHIIVSDELVALADGDGELEAIFAHELGHIEHHHGVQSVLRSSMALLLVTSLTGDLSTLTTLAGTIPFVILQRGYSRAFESEADDYARTLMLKAGYDTNPLVSVLQKLEDARPQEGVDYSYLSTHPHTTDRIRELTDSRHLEP